MTEKEQALTKNTTVHHPSPVLRPETKPSRREEFVWLGLVGFLPLVFGPFLNDTFALPKITLLRVGVCLLIGLAARQTLRAQRLSVVPTSWNRPVLLFLAVIGLSALVSDFKAVGFWGFTGFYVDGWTSWGCYLFLWWYAVNRLTDKAVSKTINVMVYAGAAVSVYALLQASGFDIFVWRTGQAAFDRPWSTLGNPNYMGAYMAMILPLAAHRLLSAPSPKGYMFLALPLACLPFTSSQAAWGGAAAGMMIWGLWEWRRIKKYAWTAALALTLGAALCVIIGLWRAHHESEVKGGLPTFAPSIATEFNPTGQAIFGRLEMWEAAVRMWKNNFWLGVGPDGSVYSFKRFVGPEFEKILGQGVSTAYAHNSVLNVAASFGTLGLLLYLWLGFELLKTVRHLWNSRGKVVPKDNLSPAGAAAASIAAVWVNNQFSFHNPATAVYAWILMGVLVKMSTAVSPRVVTVSPPTVLREPLRWSAGFLSGVFGLLFIGFVAANRYHRLAEDAFLKRQDWRSAAADAKKAVRWNPFAAPHRIFWARMLQEGILQGKNIEERTRRLEESLREYERQVKKTPLDPLAQNGLGVSLIRGGFLVRDQDYWSRAIPHFQKALEADPYMAEAVSNIANCLYLLGQKEKAVAEYQRAIAERPDVPHFILSLGDIYAAENRPRDALQQWQKVLKMNPDDPEALSRIRQLWSTTAVQDE